MSKLYAAEAMAEEGVQLEQYTYNSLLNLCAQVRSEYMAVAVSCFHTCMFWFVVCLFVIIVSVALSVFL
jgi:hypothetical protein